MTEPQKPLEKKISRRVWPVVVMEVAKSRIECRHSALGLERDAVFPIGAVLIENYLMNILRVLEED